VNYASWDDEQLIGRVASADSGALGALYDRYGRLVFSLALHILYDDALAEEVTQDVFVQLWNKAGLYHPELGRVVTWLMSMARNRGIDVLRRQSVRPEGHRAAWEDGVSPELHETVAVEHLVELEQQKATLLSAISQLPEDQRQTLALAYFQGYSHQQIADALDQPLGTVKTRLRLAMQKLRQTLVKDSVSAP
jgi:RNA polymerase sigma-70 factor, ECF subfamily